MIVLSYRESYTIYDRCNYPNSTHQSDFRIHYSETEEDAAEWIAERIREDERADFNHIVVDDWKTLENMAQHGYLNSPQSGVESINLAWTHEDKYEDQKVEQRNGELHARITELVREKLEPKKWC
jgi:hypothetical protein